MNFRQFLWSRFRRWLRGGDDWYRRQLDADQFDRECIERERTR